MKGVATFGELMMRLTPPGFERFTQCDKWCITYGGAEANVAVALSVWGGKTAFISKMSIRLKNKASAPILSCEAEIALAYIILKRVPAIVLQKLFMTEKTAHSHCLHRMNTIGTKYFVLTIGCTLRELRLRSVKTPKKPFLTRLKLQRKTT